MPDAPAARGGGKGAGGFLTQKMGPLPLWAWFAVGGGGLFLLVKMGVLGGGGSNKANAGLVTVTTPQGQQIQVPASQAGQYLNQGVPSGFVPESSITQPQTTAQQQIPTVTIGGPWTERQDWVSQHGPSGAVYDDSSGKLAYVGDIPNGTVLNVTGPPVSQNWGGQMNSFIPVSWLGKQLFISANEIANQGFSTGTAAGSLTNTSLSGLQAAETA